MMHGYLIQMKYNGFSDFDTTLFEKKVLAFSGFCFFLNFFCHFVLFLTAEI